MVEPYRSEKNDGVRQLNSQLDGKIIQPCSKPPTRNTLAVRIGGNFEKKGVPRRKKNVNSQVYCPNIGATPVSGPNCVEIPNKKTWFRNERGFRIIFLHHQIQKSKFAFFGIVYTISGNTHG